MNVGCKERGKKVVRMIPFSSKEMGSLFTPSSFTDTHAHRTVWQTNPTHAHQHTMDQTATTKIAGLTICRCYLLGRNKNVRQWRKQKGISQTIDVRNRMLDDEERMSLCSLSSHRPFEWLTCGVSVGGSHPKERRRKTEGREDSNGKRKRFSGHTCKYKQGILTSFLSWSVEPVTIFNVCLLLHSFPFFPMPFTAQDTQRRDAMAGAMFQEVGCYWFYCLLFSLLSPIGSSTSSSSFPLVSVSRILIHSLNLCSRMELCWVLREEEREKLRQPVGRLLRVPILFYAFTHAFIPTALAQVMLDYCFLSFFSSSHTRITGRGDSVNTSFSHLSFLLLALSLFFHSIFAHPASESGYIYSNTNFLSSSYMYIAWEKRREKILVGISLPLFSSSFFFPLHFTCSVPPEKRGDEERQTSEFIPHSLLVFEELLSLFFAEEWRSLEDRHAMREEERTSCASHSTWTSRFLLILVR